MKKLLLVLAASLAVNAALVGLFLTRSPAPAPAKPSSIPTSGSGPVVEANPITPAPADRNASRAAAPGAPFDTAEARALRDRMRAAGFPEDLVRAVVRDRLRIEFDARQADIMGYNDPIPPFWDVRAMSVLDPARQKDQRELGQALNAATDELLGANWRYTEDLLASIRSSYGELPFEKMVGLREITQEFANRRLEAQRPNPGDSIGNYRVQLPEDAAKLAQLAKDERAAIVALLTPEQLEEYDLRRSNSASTLRSTLRHFQPTEEEFRALFKLQRAFDEKHSSASSANPDSMRERGLAQQELKEDIAKALSPERADLYRAVTEIGAASLVPILQRLSLPMSTIAPVLSVKKEIRAQAAALGLARPAFPAEARNRALAELRQQATDRLTSLLGADGLAAYNASDSWIQSLR